MEKDTLTISSEDIGGLSINLPMKAYQCSKGHIWKGNGESRLIVWQENTEADHYSFCPFCYIEWFRQNISELKEMNE